MSEEAVDGRNRRRHAHSESRPRGRPRPIQIEKTEPCSRPHAGKTLGKSVNLLSLCQVPNITPGVLTHWGMGTVCLSSVHWDMWGGDLDCSRVARCFL